jgi:PQQ enzyme-like repeat protein
MKRLFLIGAATAMAIAVCPAVAITIPPAGTSAATITTAITLKPAARPPTTTATVNGTGFGPDETVSVDFDTTPAATAITSADGSFATGFTVPAAALPGRHTVTATGQSSSLSASAFFWVRTNWTKFHRGDRNSGFNPYENVLSPANVASLTKAWSHRTGLGIGFSSPAVVHGVVYVGSDDHNVYALNAATGAQLWSHPTGGYMYSSPSVVNGAVFVGSLNGKLYKFHL